MITAKSTKEEDVSINEESRIQEECKKDVFDGKDVSIDGKDFLTISDP